MVTTHSEDVREQLVSLRNQGRADGGGWLDHARLGFNYRIDDIRAALGIGQLQKLETILTLRRAAAGRYAELLADVEGVTVPLEDDADHVRSWFVYVVTLDRGVDREHVIGELERQGIATSRYLPSIHLQAYMRERYGFSRGAVPGLRGSLAADAGAAVLHRDRGGRPGTRRAGAPRRPRIRKAARGAGRSSVSSVVRVLLALRAVVRLARRVTPRARIVRALAAVAGTEVRIRERGRRNRERADRQHEGNGLSHRSYLPQSVTPSPVPAADAR